ncbi:MAG TPA: ATP synthase subunit I [Vicinamibacterales bacterium]|nr:ATP synthase subunit I [Vicinamibacterales bacterium]
MICFAVLHRVFVQRVFLLLAAIIAAGLAVAWFAAGRTGAVSFSAGALVSAASFWLLSRVTTAMGGAKPSPLGSILITVRLLIAGWVLYLVLERYEIDRAVLACGLLTPVAAVSANVLLDRREASNEESEEALHIAPPDEEK